MGGTQIMHCSKKRKHYSSKMTAFVLQCFTKIIHKYVAFFFFQNSIITKQVWDRIKPLKTKQIKPKPEFKRFTGMCIS